MINYIIERWWKIILLPHSFHKIDNQSNDFIFLQGLLQESNEDITITKNIKETYEIYRQNKIDLCLSERLHSIILCQVYWIPFVWISYSRKTLELLKKL